MDVKLYCSLLFFFLGSCIKSSAQFSIATDASLLRNFNERQKFWSFGQTVQLNFHITDKESVYTWISYYTNGRFKNNFLATAKDLATSPQDFYYTTYTGMRYRHLSIGWKHYFVGGYNSENIWNIYGYAGFGLLMGKANNRNSRTVDTSLYQIESPREGDRAFKRLTFDAGFGTEMPLGAFTYIYAELRSWTPTSHYPSPYLYQNNYHLPGVAAANLGLRILIE